MFCHQKCKNKHTHTHTHEYTLLVSLHFSSIYSLAWDAKKCKLLVIIDMKAFNKQSIIILRVLFK